MNVTIVCEVLGEENNGTTIAAMNLIRYLIKKGNKVNIVCPDQNRKNEENYYVLPIKNFGKLGNFILKKNCVSLAKYDEKVLRDAIKDADIVHFMVPLFIAKKASKLAKSMNKPITAGFHAQAENFTSHLGLKDCRLANHLAYKYYNNNLFCRVDAIHYPTEFIKDLFEKEIKHSTNGYVISNGVNDIFKPMKIEKKEEFKDKFVILFTGRLSKEKSHMVLIKAVEKSKYKDKIQLIFAGKGPLENKIVKYSKKHLINQPIISFFTRDELVKTINMCDLYCHPAEIEIEAISCLEAICSGLVPIIANSPRCATKAFALDERSLFKVNDYNDLAKKIDYFIENKEEKEKLRLRYLESSVSFEQNHCMEMMENMLKETIINFNNNK